MKYLLTARIAMKYYLTSQSIAGPEKIHLLAFAHTINLKGQKPNWVDTWMNEK